MRTTMQTFSNEKYIYSVDMMFAYINLFKKNLEVESIPVDEIKNALEFKGWGDPRKKLYSPKDVLKNPKKYPDEVKRIENADLKYPIIMFENPGFIVDGVHRLTKAVLENKKTIRAYVFGKDIMKKFKIAKAGEWDKIDNIHTNEIIETFYKHFCM